MQLVTIFYYVLTAHSAYLSYLTIYQDTYSFYLQDSYLEVYGNTEKDQEKRQLGLEIFKGN